MYVKFQSTPIVFKSKSLFSEPTFEKIYETEIEAIIKMQMQTYILYKIMKHNLKYIHMQVIFFQLYQNSKKNKPKITIDELFSHFCEVPTKIEILFDVIL